MRCVGSRACFEFEHYVLRPVGSRAGLKLRNYVMRCVGSRACLDFASYCNSLCDLQQIFNGILRSGEMLSFFPLKSLLPVL